MEAMRNWDGRPFTNPIPEITMTTDASDTGWGAAIEEMEASGFWTSSMKRTSINQRELTAVLLGIMSFKTMLNEKVVKVLSDNISTVAYLNKLSGKINGLYNTARAIWNFTQNH